MARSEQKQYLAQALTVSTQTVGQPFDITNYSGIAVTIKTPALAAGSMFLQWCNLASTVDADWQAVNTTAYPNATVTLGASGSYTVNVHGLHVGFIRIRVTLSAGPGNYDFYILAKDF